MRQYSRELREAGELEGRASLSSTFAADRRRPTTAGAAANQRGGGGPTQIARSPPAHQCTSVIDTTASECQGDSESAAVRLSGGSFANRGRR